MPENPDLITPVQKEKAPSALFTRYYGALMLVLIASFMAAAFFIIRPMIMQIKDTNAQTDSQLLRLAEQKKYLASLEQSVSAAQSIDQDSLRKVSSALPDENNAPSLLMQFSAAGARNGVQIQSVQFNENTNVPTTPAARAVVSTSTVATVDVSLALRAGSYAEVKKFLADVEQSLRLMDVVGMSLGSVGEKGDMTYQLQLRTYQFRSVTKPVVSAAPRP